MSFVREGERGGWNGKIDGDAKPSRLNHKMTEKRLMDERKKVEVYLLLFLCMRRGFEKSEKFFSFSLCKMQNMYETYYTSAKLVPLALFLILLNCHLSF
jgi:hypothetical protein